MSKCKVFTTSLVAIVLLSSAAQGSLVSFSCDAVSSWSPSGAVISMGLSSTALAHTGITAESHSTFTVTSTVTNESSVTWTGYRSNSGPRLKCSPHRSLRFNSTCTSRTQALIRSR